MGSKRPVGMEVPVIGSDSVKWVEVSVPVSASDSRPVVAPLTEDAASCCVIGNPPMYLIWRIRKTRPCALELLKISADEEVPRAGLLILFPEALSPFVFTCANEIDTTSASNPYLLYAISVSGVAYFLRLKDISAYASYLAFSPSEILCFNVQDSPDLGPITAATAVAGCLVVGRDDGSAASFQLGVLDPNAPGFMNELRDDAGLSRLWGFMSRGRMPGSVVDLAVSNIQGRKVAFVLHSDGTIKIWDFSSQGKIVSHSLNIPGASLAQLWVGEVDYNTSLIPLGVLSKQTSEVNSEGIFLYHLRISLGERVNFFLESSMPCISLTEGNLIDAKLASNKIWILTEDRLVVQDLRQLNSTTEGQCYTLQEAFVADQLFQNSENSLDKLFQITNYIYSCSKAQMISFVSQVFLHRLLQLGVLNSSALRATFEDYGKHLTDSEFQALTMDGIRWEILSLIEHEAMSGSSVLIFKCWRDFCARYFEWWCKINSPYCLLLDSSSGAFGLIRESSFSLFRNLEKIEQFVYGTFDTVDDLLKFGLGISDYGLETEIFFDVLRCTNYFSQRLGRAVSPVFYESLVNFPTIQADVIVPILIKTLESGYDSSVAALQVSVVGADIAHQKELAEHKTLRRFSIVMLLSLQALCQKANGWGKVLDVVENYLKLLVPIRVMETVNSNSAMAFNVTASVVVQATAQVAKVMFESCLDVLLFLSYLLKIGGQIHLLQEDISRIQLELIPMIHESVTEWLIVQYIGMMPSESPVMEDFSSQLSSLRIDGTIAKASWTERLGSFGFTLSSVLWMNSCCSFRGQNHQCSGHLPGPQSFFSLVQNFIRWIIWGGSRESFSHVFGHSTELAIILLKHGQYNAAEIVLKVMDAHLKNAKLSESIQNADGEWCLLHHLLGCCLVALAQCGLQGLHKEKKLAEAVRCFFRASSGEGAAHALEGLPQDAGLPHLGFTGCVSTASWRLHYYQWVMQIFEQHNTSEAACQFALAALEQVDEATNPDLATASKDVLIDESATMIKGRLWANVFKFMLDLNEFYDAYCAIISNPDEESKHICLRRFIIVLYERGATKILCNGQLPFIGLTEKVERELTWKAARSDIVAKPNPYKLLYSFEMHLQNWRKAASYMYLYSVKLRTEMASRSHQDVTLVIQERLQAISAAINALHLVQPKYAWIDLDINTAHSESHLSKKARTSEVQSANVDVGTQKSLSFISVEKLEEEFMLTTAEHLLSLANIKWTYPGKQKQPLDLVDLLVEADLYDMAFSVIIRFWKGSELQRELEKVFSSMSLKCCPDKSSSLIGSNCLLLTSSMDEEFANGANDVNATLKLSGSSTRWEALEHYLEKYRTYHARLPVVVAETLLRSDPQIELPLWLVHLFKAGRRKNGWGMTGQESDPASLLRLYVDHGRYTEATDLLIEYLQVYASARPEDLVRRKRPFAAWFPYTALDHLWCKLEESIRSGHMSEQCKRLKTFIHDALLSHLNLLKRDSEDALASLS